LNYSSWVEFNTWILEEKWQQMRESVVLVVDDEALLRMSAADVFSEAGFEVLEASNGAQAIALMETRPDIRAVFTDVQMPGQPDGLLCLVLCEANYQAPQLLLCPGGRSLRKAISRREHVSFRNHRSEEMSSASCASC
jgi:CheY-like chemotaxis protein